MLDENDTPTASPETPVEESAETTAGTGDTPGTAPREAAAPEPAAGSGTDESAAAAPPAKKAARKSTKKTSTKKAAKKAAPAEPAADAAEAAEPAAEPAGEPVTDDAAPAAEPAKKTAKKAAAKKTTKKAAAKRTTKKAAAAPAEGDAPAGDASPAASGPAAEPVTSVQAEGETDESGQGPAATSLLFKAPEPTATRARAATKAAEPAEQAADDAPAAGGDDDATAASAEDRTGDQTGDGDDDGDSGDSGDEQGGGGNRRRRRRGGRRRRKSGGGDDSGSDDGSNGSDDDTSADKSADTSGDKSADSSDGQGSGKSKGSGNGGGKGNGGGGGNAGGRGRGGNNAGGDNGAKNGNDDSDDEGGTTRRRRRRRRAGEEGDGGPDDPQNTVTRVRKPRNAEDEITSLHGSTRLEAKKQRRREGREAGRRRAPIVSEAEFLARREAVDRVMVIRQNKDLTQIAVLEDKVLVEHYVARESQTSLIGNVYLGRVQNVLPSMEAAFIDIGKGRNAVLYAGEVNWDALGAGNGPRKIEQVLKSGQPILVQVTKDPIGHKGARLTSQVSLPGRFLVYVPDGTTSGISRKLPDTERTRLKTLLKEIVPDSAGVIVRTAAEGASEEELTRDVERLTARWSDIEARVEKGNAPALLYGEPDLTLKVVRDLFTEDFGKLVVSGDEAWDMVDEYVKHVAPELEERLEHYASDEDVFAAYRIDEQIAKGLDRKVWLPSGGSLIIDRTEAMTVVDVNTGKFTGSGGNLEETVTKNNLEAAEEMVRQLRLRDIGGIIVVDFIDMVLESNRDLVLRRLVECLGRDRTRHQVAEVTSLGLVQMTRKRIGTGLLEAFSENCEHCQGRGLIVHHEPVEPKKKQDDEPRRSRRGRGRGGDNGDNGGNGGNGNGSGSSTPKASPSPKDIAAMAKHELKPAEKTPEPAPEQAPEKGPEQAPENAPEPAAEQAPEPVTERVTEPAAIVRTESSVLDAGPQDTPAPTDETTPEPAPEPTPEPEPAPVPAGPRLVTSSRRRRASRPAGPPAGLSEQSGDGATGAELPAELPVEETAASDEATQSASGGPGEEPDASAGALDDVDTPHVPIKKKGSRKR